MKKNQYQWISHSSLSSESPWQFNNSRKTLWDLMLYSENVAVYQTFAARKSSKITLYFIVNQGRNYFILQLKKKKKKGLLMFDNWTSPTFSSLAYSSFPGALLMCWTGHWKSSHSAAHEFVFKRPMWVTSLNVEMRSCRRRGMTASILAE